MPTLNVRHQTRWNAAQALFKGLVAAAYRENSKLLYRGSIIDPSQIMICDEGIYVLSLDLRCRTIWFEPKEGWNHGLYTKTKDFEREVRRAFKLAKILNW